MLGITELIRLKIKHHSLGRASHEIFGLAKIFLFSAEKPHYLTTTVNYLDLEESVLANGTLHPIKQVSVGAQVNGQLKSLHVRLGQHVKKGQLLAEIDPIIPKNELKKATAELASIRAQKNAKEAWLKHAALALQRQRLLVANDAGSQAEQEQAVAQKDATEAELLALEAKIRKAQVDVDIAQANLGYTRITAPIDGEVVAVVTKEGQTVVSTQSAPTILILANLDTMTVKTQISEADVIRTHTGQEVYFTILGIANKRFYSRLRAIEPASESVVNASSTSPAASNNNNERAIYYNGLFDVVNPGHMLKPSMTAQVSIVQRKAKHVLAIPISAIDKSKDGQDQVRVLRNNKPETRTVKIGLNDAVNVQVISGLAAGEEVIIGDSTASPSEIDDEK